MDQNSFEGTFCLSLKCSGASDYMDEASPTTIHLRKHNGTVLQTRNQAGGKRLEGRFAE